MYVIGLDLGTTSTKAVVFDLLGNVITETNVDYPLDTPHPGWAEQDPEVIRQAAEQAVSVLMQRVSSQELVGIGISSAMHSLIIMDDLHQPITKAIIWADNRSAAQAEKLRRSNIGHEIYLKTGTPIHPMSPFTKIIWFKENQPDIFKRAAKFISVKEYILYRWFGKYVTDYSIASATGLFNLEDLDYDQLALCQAGINHDQLSTPVPTTHILQGMEVTSADRMGIPTSLPVVIGASDGCLANLGIGSLAQGEIAITVGTSAAIRTVVPKPLTDSRERTFCYALSENHWVVGGASNNGGILLRWFRDRFATGQNYDQLTEAATSVPPGSEGLLCLPYLAGERAPIWNAEARGCFVGMALHHDQRHFARAVLEGVVFNLLGIGVALRDLSGDFKVLKASGGFVRSPLWCQILSDMFGAEVIVPANPQSSSWGAAILALLATGHIASIEHYKDTTMVGHRFTPNEKAHKDYQELFQLYDDVYQNLKGSFQAISNFYNDNQAR